MIMKVVTTRCQCLERHSELKVCTLYSDKYTNTLTYEHCYIDCISKVLCQLLKISILLQEVAGGVWTRRLLLPFSYTPARLQLATVLISITWPKCWVPFPIWDPSTKSFASNSGTYFNIALRSLSIDQTTDTLLCKPTSYLSCFIFFSNQEQIFL